MSVVNYPTSVFRTLQLREMGIRPKVYAKKPIINDKCVQTVKPSFEYLQSVLSKKITQYQTLTPQPGVGVSHKECHNSTLIYNVSVKQKKNKFILIAQQGKDQYILTVRNKKNKYVITVKKDIPTIKPAFETLENIVANKIVQNHTLTGGHALDLTPKEGHVPFSAYDINHNHVLTVQKIVPPSLEQTSTISSFRIKMWKRELNQHDWACKYEVSELENLQDPLTIKWINANQALCGYYPNIENKLCIAIINFKEVQKPSTIESEPESLVNESEHIWESSCQSDWECSTEVVKNSLITLNNRIFGLSKSGALLEWGLNGEQIRSTTLDCVINSNTPILSQFTFEKGLCFWHVPEKLIMYNLEDNKITIIPISQSITKLAFDGEWVYKAYEKGMIKKLRLSDRFRAILTPGDGKRIKSMQFRREILICSSRCPDSKKYFLTFWDTKRNKKLNEWQFDSIKALVSLENSVSALLPEGLVTWNESILPGLEDDDFEEDTLSQSTDSETRESPEGRSLSVSQGEESGNEMTFSEPDASDEESSEGRAHRRIPRRLFEESEDL